jgi:hypothetical protein
VHQFDEKLGRVGDPHVDAAGFLRPESQKRFESESSATTNPLSALTAAGMASQLLIPGWAISAAWLVESVGALFSAKEAMNLSAQEYRMVMVATGLISLLGLCLALSVWWGNRLQLLAQRRARISSRFERLTDIRIGSR